MNNKKNISYPNGQQPADTYEGTSVPQTYLPKEPLPDEVPRRDGPGGESGKSSYKETK